MEVLERIKKKPMSRFQVMAVTLAIALMIVDGLDVAVLAYAAPTLTVEWSVPPEALGFLLSASLIGMAISSMFLTPLSDKIGRRPFTIIALIVVLIGLLGSIVSPNLSTLIIFRFLTGLGVGGMTANLNVFVAEYSSQKKRASLLGIFAAGYAIGSTLGGVLAGPLIPAFGWRSIFVACALITLVLLLLAIFLLPESLDFLLANRPRNSLTKINAILVKMGETPIEALPAVQSSEDNRASVVEVLTPPQLIRTMALCLGYGLVAGSYYFGNTWIPQIITTSSGDAGTGVLMGSLVAAGGVVGSLAFSALALRFSTGKTVIVLLICAAAAYSLFSLVLDQIPLALFVGAAMGLLVTGGNAGFFALGPVSFSARARATGVGFMFGIGRTISFLSPILVGFLIGTGIPPHQIFNFFAVALLCAAGAILVLMRSMRPKRGEVVTDDASEAVPQR